MMFPTALEEQKDSTPVMMLAFRRPNIYIPFFENKI
jgi:hypothetical protein